MKRSYLGQFRAHGQEALPGAQPGVRQVSAGPGSGSVSWRCGPSGPRAGLGVMKRGCRVEGISRFRVVVMAGFRGNM